MCPTMAFNFGELHQQLNEASTHNPRGTGVSFSGDALKLDNEKDAEKVCDEIKKCSKMDYLDLEGNTLGPEAAKAIAEALETHGSHLKYALWKDMFTGRMKTEIPKALEYLGSGLHKAGARLVELDMSDNAFGPIGVQGLAALLSSSSCYTLKELRLNNNGLGISGGKMLAKALLDCHDNSTKEGKPLALRLFIAGRNRLENEGAAALATVFKRLGSLEEVVMPQNGIYHPGISALAEGLSDNPGLRILNLNDNTVGLKGAEALAGVLHNFKSLESLNLGDCLLKTKGAIVIANALGIRGNHVALTELNLTFNEIGAGAIESLARAVADKTQLSILQLDGNVFGRTGRDNLKDLLASSGRIESLDDLDEDVSDDEDDSGDEGSDSGEDQDGDEDQDDEEEDEDDDEEDEDDDEEDEDEEEEEEDEEEEKKVEEEDEERQEIRRLIQEDEEWLRSRTYFPIGRSTNNYEEPPADVWMFLKTPTGDNFLKITGERLKKLLDHAGDSSEGNNPQEKEEKYVNELLHVVMKVSSHCSSGSVDVRVEAEKLTDSLYSELFNYAAAHDQMSKLNNNLLVNLGLIKSEDRRAGRINWNLGGCFKALELITQKDYFPSSTRDALKLFIEKPIKTGKKFVDPFQEEKNSLKAVLERQTKT